MLEVNGYPGICLVWSMTHQNCTSKDGIHQSIKFSIVYEEKKSKHLEIL